jgi:hypothetical protein
MNWSVNVSSPTFIVYKKQISVNLYETGGLNGNMHYKETDIDNY